jgi:hypothetical protein
LSGRERFAAAVAGEGVAFAPYVWERLPQFVHQAADDWWRDGTIARRLLLDVASLAGADAMVVGACADALRAVAANGSGADVLDSFADTEEARGAFAVVEVVVASTPFAAVAWLPDLETLAGMLGGAGDEAEEVAEDALSDLARGFLEAGADALLVMAPDAGAVRAAAGRVARVAEYYRRPLLAAAGSDAWIEGREGVDVRVLGEDGLWPSPAAGVVLTEDVSMTWDADRLAAVRRDGR